MSILLPVFLTLKNLLVGKVVFVLEHRCSMESRIRELEKEQAASKVYIKELLDDISRIENRVEGLQHTPKPREEDAAIKVWQPIVIELIKLLGTAFIIISAIAGASKILGK